MEKTGNNYPRKGDIYWVMLDPTVGTEIAKTRPCVILSNNTANIYSRRVIVAPVTSKAHKVYSFEIPLYVQGKMGKILLDQVRSIDKIRLGEQIGSCKDEMIEEINHILRAVFALS